MIYKFIYCIIVIIFIFKQINASKNEIDNLNIPCTCGIFLSGQLKKGSKPTGNAVLVQELDQAYPKGTIGIKLCTNKCLETIIKHLPNSSTIICATIDRDCNKEKAHLFIKNRKYLWRNTKLSTGREFCCKNNVPHKCPFNL